jgi:23S rRNA pseudouridine1911/1915/1917 synthase
MQDLGHSIIGDAKYGATTNPIKRLGLHAQILAFKHPVSKETMRFETEIPKVFLGLF